MAEVTAKGSVCGRCLPARYVLAILGSFAMAITYALKVNLSTAMLGMLNHTAIQALSQEHFVRTESKHDLINITVDQCVLQSDNKTAEMIEDGPFIWDESLQGMILSSYFWGYIVFQVPGARIAELFSAKWVMFASVAINIVCTVLTPVMSKMHYSAMILMRILEGLGGAVTFPAMHVMLARWAPPTERGIMSSIVYAGTCLGTVVSILSAGVIASTLGWEAVFYLMGGACIPWCLFWVWLIADTPSEQKYISEEERHLITKSLGGATNQKKQNIAVPWKSVFTCTAFWAILVAHICNNWGWYMILIELPFYMRQVLHFNIKENAVLNAIPFLSMWLFSMLISKTLDKLRALNVISTTAARKIATAIASVVPGIILIGVCYIGCNRWLAVLLMTIAVTAKGGMFCGFLSNHIDIAPNFAGTLIALTNTVATIPGIIVPLFVGYLTHGNQTIGAWSIIFFVTVGLYLIEILVYSFFGSGEEQGWNKAAEDKLQEEQPLNQTNTAYRSTEQY